MFYQSKAKQRSFYEGAGYSLYALNVASKFHSVQRSPYRLMPRIEEATITCHPHRNERLACKKCNAYFTPSTRTRQDSPCRRCEL